MEFLFALTNAGNDSQPWYKVRIKLLCDFWFTELLVMFLLDQKHTEGIRLFSPMPADLAKRGDARGTRQASSLAKRWTEQFRRNGKLTASPDLRGLTAIARACDHVQTLP